MAKMGRRHLWMLPKNKMREVNGLPLVHLPSWLNRESGLADSVQFLYHQSRLTIFFDLTLITPRCFSVRSSKCLEDTIVVLD